MIIIASDAKPNIWLISVDYTSYNENLRYLEWLEKKGNVLILSPDKVLIGRASSNVCSMEEFYQQGYALAEQRKKEIREFIN